MAGPHMVILKLCCPVILNESPDCAAGDTAPLRVQSRGLRALCQEREERD